MLFPFVQLEFSEAVGPDAGRYAVAGGRHGPPPGAQSLRDDATDVLVVSVAGAEARPVAHGRRRAARPAPAPPAAAARRVPLQLVTFAWATCGEPDAGAADGLLDRCAADPAMQKAWIALALRATNEAIRGFRAGTCDPYVTEMSRRDPREVRIGLGTGAEIAEATWTRAFTVPPLEGSKMTREERIRPSTVVAAHLGGRTVPLEAEELAARVLLDLEHGRLRAAGAGACAALELAVAELAHGGRPDAAARAALCAHSVEAAELRAALLAADGPPSREGVEQLAGLLVETFAARHVALCAAAA